MAQYTAEQEIDGVYHDDVEPPEGLSVRNKTERRRALRVVYGDAVAGTRNGDPHGVRAWINLDRIESEILALLPRDPAQAERYFLNRKEAAEDAAFDLPAWKGRASGWVVPPRELVTVGVDGARFRDALAMVATQVRVDGSNEKGHQWTVGIWERPDNASHGYEHPFDEIDAAMVQVFADFDVWRAYVDPQHIEHLLERWQGRWGSRIQPWWTNRNRQIAWAVRGYEEAIAAGDLSHDGDPKLTEHIGNAKRQKVNVFDEEHRQMHTISKERPDSPRKMDGAMAGVLSWECRGDAIADGAESRSRRMIVV